MNLSSICKALIRDQHWTYLLNFHCLQPESCSQWTLRVGSMYIFQMKFSSAVFSGGISGVYRVQGKQVTISSKHTEISFNVWLQRNHWTASSFLLLLFVLYLSCISYTMVSKYPDSIADICLRLKPHLSKKEDTILSEVVSESIWSYWCNFVGRNFFYSTVWNQIPQTAFLISL